MKPKFTGIITALVTPFKKGRVDFKSLKRLVRSQIDNGVEGFVVNGTTGESPTLEWKEVKEIFKTVKKETDGAVPLILGTGSNCTRTTIEKTEQAKKMGADAALVVVPYYNKPPQRGLIAHYKAVAKKARVPVILYNVPGRTIISMTAETVAELASEKRIVGIKEASGNMELLSEIKKNVPESFLLSSGDDGTCIDFMLAGGHGVVSVISHLIPSQLRQLADEARLGRRSAAESYVRFRELNKLMSIEANPIPVKMGLYLQGLIDSPELRLPLVSLSEEATAKLKAEMTNLGIL